MILGSHNLGKARFDLIGNPKAPSADWNTRFDGAVQSWVASKDFKSLANYASHPDAKNSVPTPEHFLPIMVVAGAAY